MPMRLSKSSGSRGKVRTHGTTWPAPDQSGMPLAARVVETIPAPAFFMSPLTTGGDPSTAELIFAPNGEAVMAPESF